MVPVLQEGRGNIEPYLTILPDELRDGDDGVGRSIRHGVLRTVLWIKSLWLAGAVVLG